MGFSLFKARIFGGSLFRQAKFLASSEQRVESPVYFSETGTISRENLPMNTGYMTAEKEHMTWAVIHSLKLKLKKYGQPVQNNRVLLISERSYVPLDPQNRIKQKDKDKISSLKDIAQNRHDIERAIVNSDNSSGKTPLTEVVTYGSIFVIVICVIASFF